MRPLEPISFEQVRDALLGGTITDVVGGSYFLDIEVQHTDAPTVCVSIPVLDKGTVIVNPEVPEATP